jgi:hypothetical protein
MTSIGLQCRASQDSFDEFAGLLYTSLVVLYLGVAHN